MGVFAVAFCGGRHRWPQSYEGSLLSGEAARFCAPADLAHCEPASAGGALHWRRALL